MEFEATESEVIEMGRLAVNAARPVGLGMLHFVAKDYTCDEVRPYINAHGLDIDYFAGRMTKLTIRRKGTVSWEVHGDPRSDYQSWCSKYPTYQALIDAARQPHKDS